MLASATPDAPEKHRRDLLFRLFARWLDEGRRRKDVLIPCDLDCFDSLRAYREWQFRMETEHLPIGPLIGWSGSRNEYRFQLLAPWLQARHPQTFPFNKHSAFVWHGVQPGHTKRLT
jgi:hypothetical protein